MSQFAANLKKLPGISHLAAINLLDADGNVLFTQDGTRGEVEIDEATGDRLKGQVAVSIHNHPNKKTPISQADVMSGLAMQVGEMRVVVGDGIYSLRYNGQYPDLRTADKFYDKTTYRIMDEAFSGPREQRQKWAHLVNKDTGGVRRAVTVEVAREYGWTFTMKDVPAY